MADGWFAVPEGLVGQRLGNVKKIACLQRQCFRFRDDSASALLHIGQKVKGGALAVVRPVEFVEVEADKTIAGREKCPIHRDHPHNQYRILPFLNRITYCGEKSNMI